MNEEFDYVQEEAIVIQKNIYDYIEERLNTKELKYTLEFQYLRQRLLNLEEPIQSSKVKKMPITEVLCEVCTGPASWLAVEVPNPDRGWCNQCHREVGSKTNSYCFCSSKCMKIWVDAYHSSNTRR